MKMFCFLDLIGCTTTELINSEFFRNYYFSYITVTGKVAAVVVSVCHQTFTVADWDSMGHVVTQTRGRAF